MIRENLLKEEELFQPVSRIVLQTPREKVVNKELKIGRSKSYQKPAKKGRNFEGLYLESTDRWLEDETHLLYHGGSPVFQEKQQENYKALPLTVAKINFKHEIKRSKELKNPKTYRDNFVPFMNVFGYEMSFPISKS